MDFNLDFKCNKYRKIKNPKISYVFYKTVLSIICDKYDSKDETIFNGRVLNEYLIG